MIEPKKLSYGTTWGYVKNFGKNCNLNQLINNGNKADGNTADGNMPAGNKPNGNKPNGNKANGNKS